MKTIQPSQQIIQEAQVLQTRTGKFWLEDDGILRIVSFSVTDANLNDARENIDAICQVIQGQPRLALVDIRPTVASNNEELSFYSKNKSLKENFRAMALIVSSPVTKVIGSLILGIYRLPFPIKIFSEESDAIPWLLQFQRNVKS